MSDASLTPGLLRAMSKGNVRATCPKCHFPLPRYPGRYPKKCPHCGHPMWVIGAGERGAVRGGSPPIPDPATVAAATGGTNPPIGA